jgi:PAS domain S-box-containing protein
MSKENPEEIKLSSLKSIYSKTDLNGTIKYVNDYFTEVSGYTQEELLGSQHNIIRHPDMPKVIFKLMWERIQKNEDILAVVKNRTKDGDYYWITTLFETKYHPFYKNPEGYAAIRRAAPKKAVEEMIPLYAKLVEYEKMDGIEASQEYLLKFLREKNMDYDTYMMELVEYKGVVVEFFNKMRKMFD